MVQTGGKVATSLTLSAALISFLLTGCQEKKPSVKPFYFKEETVTWEPKVKKRQNSAMQVLENIKLTNQKKIDDMSKQLQKSIKAAKMRQKKYNNDQHVELYEEMTLQAEKDFQGELLQYHKDIQALNRDLIENLRKSALDTSKIYQENLHELYHSDNAFKQKGGSASYLITLASLAMLLSGCKIVIEEPQSKDDALAIYKIIQ